MARLYAATGDGFARLDEASEAWTAELSLSGSGAQCLAIDPADPDTVFVGLREGGVRRSVDNVALSSVGGEQARRTLLGRERECEAIDRLLRAAHDSQGEGLVVHGEPGIGKTALLEYAIAAAQDFQVMRAVGNEAEMGLPFAALQQLCSPGLAGLEQLPEPQRDALQVAFGLTTGVAPDRFLVGLAVVSLLSQLGTERPLLCVIDDTQWLDRESAQAFGFVARRLVTARIAFIFATRTITDEVRGLPELIVEGMGDVAATTLLRSVLPNRVDERVLERFVAKAHGNPLALLELPRGLTPAQLAGGFALPVSVPLARRIEASYRRRLTTMPPASRRLLLVAAAGPTGDPLLVWRTAEQRGVDETAAATVEGLLDFGARIVFPHPLLRSAIYRAASAQDRREAHRALARATDAAVDPDRHAWHRAQATARPDEDVAAEVELSAGRAEGRGGVAAAAAFMERSAELTVDPASRARRALVAAEHKRQTGALDPALALATIAEQGPLDDLQHAQSDVLRTLISFASDRGRDATLLMIKAAQRLQPHDASRARETYLDAITAALFAGRFAHGFGARDVASAALAALRPVGSPRASDLLLDGLARLIVDGPASGTAVLKRALDAFRGQSVATEERLRWSLLAGRAAAFIWDYDTWDELTARQLEVARDAGALTALASGELTVLPLTLSMRASVHMFAGELSVAASLIEQVLAVADATDSRTACYAAVMLAALHGREHEARELIDANAKDFASRGEGMAVTLTQWATALLYNGIGRYNDAFVAADAALQDPRELWYSPWATVELIEAASRSGRAAAAAPALERLAEGTSASGTVWGAAIEDRSRAVLSEGPVAESLYRDAIDRLAPTPLRFDLARTHLVYGEWLRRERRNVDAREQLRIAHRLFTEFGMEGFAERARIELRATGEHARKRTPETGNDLTPQEAEISRLVAQGKTNVEIAAQLFIRPSTVEYHLCKVFRKLDVKSRTQLARHVLESHGPANGQKPTIPELRAGLSDSPGTVNDRSST